MTVHVSLFQEDKERGEDEHPLKEHPKAHVKAPQVFLRQIHFRNICARLVCLSRRGMSL